MSNVDSDLKQHQETWDAFVKGSTWLAGLSALVLILMAIFIV